MVEEEVRKECPELMTPFMVNLIPNVTLSQESACYLGYGNIPEASFKRSVIQQTSSHDLWYVRHSSKPWRKRDKKGHALRRPGYRHINKRVQERVWDYWRSNSEIRRFSTKETMLGTRVG